MWLSLGTGIESEFESNIYSSPKEFVDDVWFTFAKAKKLNLETRKVHCIARMLEAIFEAWWQDTITKMDNKIEYDDDDDDNK